MSGITPRTWFLGANSRRGALEAGLLAFVLMLPLAIVFAAVDEESRWSVLVLGAMETGLCVGLLGAARLRVVRGGRLSTLLRDGTRGIALSVTTGAGAGLALLAAVVWLIARRVSVEPWEPFVTAAVVAVFAFLAALIVFAIGRAVVYAWVFWDSKRRTRLHWSLTHALLVGSMTLAVVAGALLTAADFRGALPFSDDPQHLLPDAGRLETIIGLVTLRYVPSAIALFLVSLAVGLIIVPPGALIAYPVLQRATRRLEDLAAAAVALRAGDLRARTPVAGDDEIARLQVDFNAMAADLERAQDELRAERDAVSRLLGERRELIATVSHELRTPVATLRGYLESALAHWESSSPPTLRHDLGAMTGEMERLHRLIDDLFTLSRAEVGHLPISVQPTDVAALVDRCATAAALLAWERGRVKVLAQVPGSVTRALADPARLEQVVRNLVANAVRHTPPGGLVLLTVEHEDDKVVIRVQDTGAGIAPTDLPCIWDRFFRSVDARDEDSAREQARDGAGLGLALVKELTEAMNGMVEVESVLGEGSCFTLRLPFAGDGAGHEAAALS